MRSYNEFIKVAAENEENAKTKRRRKMLIGAGIGAAATTGALAGIYATKKGRLPFTNIGKKSSDNVGSSVSSAIRNSINAQPKALNAPNTETRQKAKDLYVALNKGFNEHNKKVFHDTMNSQQKQIRDAFADLEKTKARVTDNIANRHKELNDALSKLKVSDVHDTMNSQQKQVKDTFADLEKTKARVAENIARQKKNSADLDKLLEELQDF